MPERRMDSWNRCKAVLLLLACALLTACGGGGGTEGKAAEDTDDPVLAGLLAAPITEAQAVRFLWKSSFGPTTESIARLRQLGYARFVDEQLAIPAGRYNDYMLGTVNPTGMAAYCAQYPEPLNFCYHWIQYSTRATSVLFLKAAVHDQDQLNLRMAWALSQILVVSTKLAGQFNYGNRIYQQILRNEALGNYKDLLIRISKNPYMGDWLDLAGSHKNNPNQNYARELLQLFSVGTFARYQDGTFITDLNGHRVENYTQQHILAFSKALSGWHYGGLGYNDYSVELIANPAAHDATSKTLLNGKIIPAGKTAESELIDVVNNVFGHSSTAPNIVRQLIQFLVTSNPSSAYVARVVKVWNNNGKGVAGDLKAVARAILLDAESLNPPDQGGRLLEPVLAMTGLFRSIGGNTDGVALDEAVEKMQQRPFSAPSVFNYYPPDYILPLHGMRRFAPQFGIVSLPTVVARLSTAKKFIFSDEIAPDLTIPTVIRNGSALIWREDWKIMAGNNLPNLVNQLNIRLAAGVLEAEQRNHIVTQVGAMPSGSDAANLQRLRMAAWLVFSSPQFMAHR